ncbi:mechanosensitive ion channel family protein [Burkholderia catarinensis]|uniref:mechanosensitive ion channel family protein n=1 Tax=Burkholderia catarinensis TaxID=1108140 RepID=UPI000921309A|nr:mechanosensitive ion channel family protein [Burkholderia catarinensis]KAG8153764.1 mechanosensitive ion channel protein MscS [Burkholderia catarinensis]
MLTFSHAVLYGAPIVMADVVAWRLLGRGSSIGRTIWRCTAFAALTYVLFTNGVSPVAVPVAQELPVRLAIQAICVAWWLQCAIVISLMLDHLLLPRSWRTQRLFHDIAAGAIFGAAGIAALGYVLGLPLSGLMATSGAMAVILGLAIQNTLNDVFSGLVLNTTRPFRLNDTVAIGDLEGRVIESNWRATKLINGLGNLVVVPNSAAAKATIVNLSEPASTHGVTLVLEIDPEVRPSVVLDALERAAATSQDVLANPAPISSVRAFRTSSVEYELICYVDAIQKKTSVRNQLYDLVHRHLSAADVVLRPLAAPLVARPSVSHRQRLLRAVELFSNLDDADLAVLADALTQHRFSKGDVVYASNADTRTLTLLEAGVVSVVVPGSAGNVEVRRMAPGDAIGQSVVLAGTKLHATAYAMTPVRVYQLDSNALSPLIGRTPELGKLMCQSLTEHIATEERLMIPPAAKEGASFSLVAWLEKEMRLFHQAIR